MSRSVCSLQASVYCVSYDIVMNVRAGVHRAAVQWAVVSSNCLPGSMEVIGHDVDEVKVSVDFKHLCLD